MFSLKYFVIELSCITTYNLEQKKKCLQKVVTFVTTLFNDELVLKYACISYLKRSYVKLRLYSNRILI